ncbi:MAG: hypothetical protein COS76_04415 [Candidatus Portnoybacteria bacterium CG06_land_8_20_14_3_00_39_12]|uniref:Creatininase n=2 Tax=Parcubacteria group TaxID=1794811 RepID=A0A2M7AVW2_9BACT|nr:MAG: hypothetical protein COS76_04415 [Candidatus Portnoybacteria bacterium CG06_land_8_20_14_3_00_39_12]PIZ88623.1 MAG: hypothetical protein COX90_03630 [Candidatus Nealsonbacteria bacterium CG_4_10_14_0_2_um_filter_38_17]
MLNLLNTTAELKKSKCRVAVVPIGSIEQHSDYLPLGTDLFIAETLAKKIAEVFKAYLLPILPYSNSQEHDGTPGTVWLSPVTLINVINDLVESLIRSGMKKIILVNAHGGNHVIKSAIVNLKIRYPKIGIFLAPLSWEKAYMAGNVNTNNAVHADPGETSLLYYVLNLSNKKRKIKKSVPLLSYELLESFGFKSLTKNGAWGESGTASYDKGRKIFETLLKSSVKELKQALKFNE